LLYTTQLRRIGKVAGEILGPAMTADSGEWGTYAWSGFLTGAPGLRIAGGTDEIQRNTISERALGLPKEPSPK
jgi:alkylation response protein AidB-like acyl-CoA dehydrogenase